MRRASVLGAAIIALLGSTALVVEFEPAPTAGTVEFGGRTWRVQSPDRAVAREYGGKTALHLTGTQTSSAFLPDVEFRNGTIEVDIAAPGRATPGIGFRGRRNGQWSNRILFNHWAGEQKGKHDVIEQAVVTRRTNTTLLLNIRRPARPPNRPWKEANDWFHVKVVVRADSVKIFLSDKTKPDIEVGEMLTKGEKGTLGLCGGDCYFANFRYTRAE